MLLKQVLTVFLAMVLVTLGANSALAQNSDQNKATGSGQAQSNEEISKALSNPLANIINMPLQFNWDYGGGPHDHGNDYYLKIQPVIPVELSDDWLLISRSILIVEDKFNFGYGDKFGLGDFQQTFFFAPMPKGKGGFIWGAGPVFLLPAATEQELGQKKWGAGPSAVGVYESENWTVGLLASHTWSFAGDSKRDDVNATFLQPFIARHLPGAVTITATSEYTHDWEHDEDVVPINLMVAKVVTIGKMPVSFSLGGRYYIEKPKGGPDWGLRFMVTFVLPGFN